ncbi:MAG: hypothetical protein M1838_005285 [Thelocarpon superellum]|nr:MAG: hypothetical protein M1838_005285 [Thelocarpon superellum]
MAATNTSDANDASIGPLPAPFSGSAHPPRLLAQGAEAHVYRTTYLMPTLPCALKYRPSKPYRHPTLDQRLTRHRLLSEARGLHKCRRAGVRVPGVYALDADAGWLLLEWIEGRSLRNGLEEWLKGDGVGDAHYQSHVPAMQGLMRQVGHSVGAMHAAGVVHGDLTTSNLMLRPPPTTTPPTPAPASGSTNEGVAAPEHPGASVVSPVVSPLAGDVVVIDFGLSMQSVQDEDRAVDLYVLERAFGSTHPRAESLFDDVLQAYGQSFKGAMVVLRRLEDVRMRGRKRSMLG